MPSPPRTRNAILAAIREHGPMTVAELVEVTGKTRHSIDAAIINMRERGTEFLRVKGYQRQVGNGGIAASIYDLGPGKDAKRPDLSTIEAHRERQARYRDKNRAVINARTNARRGRPINPFLQLMR